MMATQERKRESQDATPQQSAYAEKLRSPRWQRRRLEIYQRDDFTCQVCGSKDKELQVHHIKYKKDMEPWDYMDEYLITLCKDCHQIEGTHREAIEVFLMFKLFRAHFGAMELVSFGQCLNDDLFVMDLRHIISECFKRNR